MIPPAELIALGEGWEAAWGRRGREGWIPYLAAELPVHVSTVRRWRRGAREMMPAVEPRVREILGRRPAP